MRRLIVGVMGSGQFEYVERSEPLGEWIARQGFHLLTGGGKGVMAAVSRGFQRINNRPGSTIAIIPSDPGERAYRPKDGYPNPWVEIPIFTHLPLTGKEGTEPLSRNHINVLSSDVVIALPGGTGTLSEIQLAISYGRPLVAFLEHEDELQGLPRNINVCHTLEDLAEFVKALANSRINP